MLKLRESLRTLEQFTRKALRMRHAAATVKQQALLDDIAAESLALQAALWQLALALDENITIACEILP